MNAPNKPDGETSMSAQAEGQTETKSRKSHKKRKSRDSKHRSASTNDDGAGKSSESAVSRASTTSKTRKHSSKSPDKGAQEAQKPPEAAADSNPALPSSSPITQDQPKPPAAELATKGGRLVGRMVIVDGVALTRFLGVPFAQSTAGVRRFLVPLPMSPPQNPCEVLEYLEPRPPCAQWSNGSVLGSEDCLHVNVWTPATAVGDNGNGGGHALVVAVSGSWFEAGSNDDPDWPQLAAKGNVVVVAPNHRQGVLGFLHPSSVAGVVQDPAVDDVVFAVQWALDNAKFFGADPKQLVLVGRGSGAYLLSMASSSMPNGTALRAFYHGIVYGSLLPLDPKDKNEPYHSLASALRCNNTADKAVNVSALEPCFRAASADDLVRASRGFSDFPLRFAPRVDIALLLMSPAARTRTVIAGLDMAELRNFFTQRVLPLAQRDGNASSPEALLDYTLNVFNVPRIEKSLLKSRFNITNVEGLVRKLPCSTQRIAKAAVEGYHYLFDSAMPSRFLQPPIGISQLAQFVSLGTAPPLADNSPWLPLSKLSKTRLISKDGHENLTNLDDECTV